VPGAKPTHPPVAEPKFTRPGNSRRRLAFLIFVAVLLLVMFLPLLLVHKTDQPVADPAYEGKKPTQELSTKEVGAILLQSYAPSLNMLNQGVDVSAGRWFSFQEGQTVRCGSDNCYYLSYQFNIIDAQGKSHDVECEWDIDSTSRTAIPRNPQARYYWMPK